VATLNSARPGDDATARDADAAATTGSSHRAARRSHRRGRRGSAAPHSRIAYALGLTAVCALAGVNLATTEPAASTTGTQELSASASVADALGIAGTAAEGPTVEDRALLGQLAASRAERDATQAAAAASQAKTEKAAAKAKAKAKAEAKAKAKAKAEAKAKAKAEAKARAAAEAAETAAAEAPATASAAAAAPAPAAAGTAATVLARISNTAGPVRPQAQAAANAVVSNVPGAAGITIGGTRASAADPGGHPSGLALDYMVGSNAGLGDAIAQYHIAHWDELGVDYIIWQQRMLSSPGGSWSAMSDRGSPTANHMDHPHVNYRG
jgi:hypothetical protein